jgi:hypothetical protein
VGNPYCTGGPGRNRTDEEALGLFRNKNDCLVNEDGKYQITKLRPTHEAIMNFLLANPQLAMREIAVHFEVSPGWIYTLVQTDAFQAELTKRQEKLFDATVATIHTKTVGTAHHALDRLNELLPLETNTKIVADTADQLLRNLGYGAKTPGVQVNVQQNHHHVPNEVLVEARGALLAVAVSEQPRSDPAAISVEPVRSTPAAPIGASTPAAPSDPRPPAVAKERLLDAIFGEPAPVDAGAS